jgi:hypothetical protein
MMTNGLVEEDDVIVKVAAKSPMMYSAYSAISPDLCRKAVHVAWDAQFHAMFQSPAVETSFVGVTVPNQISNSQFLKQTHHCLKLNSIQ